MKKMGITDINGARANVKDIVVFGNGDMFKLLSKASSEKEGWMKSTKAMEIPGVGCVVQVTTQQRNQAQTTFLGNLAKLVFGDKFKPEISYTVAEALTFVPGATIVKDKNNGSKLELTNK